MLIISIKWSISFKAGITLCGKRIVLFLKTLNEQYLQMYSYTGCFKSACHTYCVFLIRKCVKFIRELTRFCKCFVFEMQSMYLFKNIFYIFEKIFLNFMAILEELYTKWAYSLIFQELSYIEAAVRVSIALLVFSKCCLLNFFRALPGEKRHLVWRLYRVTLK